jgi:hypothetical protein
VKKKAANPERLAAGGKDYLGLLGQLSWCRSARLQRLQYPISHDGHSVLQCGQLQQHLGESMMLLRKSEKQ